MRRLFGLSLLLAVAALVGLGTTGRMASEGDPYDLDVGTFQACESELVEKVRIGSLDGPEEYVFSHINSVAVGESGSMYVADIDLVSIREFGADGRFVREIGRSGEGPGEVLSIAGISVLADGRLATWDRRNRRITTYGADGEYDETIRVDALSPPFPFVDRAFSTDSAG
ncbi:MAG: 6-bladed beta-propeller, partial [Gemmatimonadota bacterium]|nr:6-bladed beta-propeller [Gemmatimonadota bacterium]